MDWGLNAGTGVAGVAVALILYALYQFVMFGVVVAKQARMPAAQKMAISRLKRVITSMALMFAIIWISQMLGLL